MSKELGMKKENDENDKRNEIFNFLRAKISGISPVWSKGTLVVISKQSGLKQ